MKALNVYTLVASLSLVMFALPAPAAPAAAQKKPAVPAKASTPTNAPPAVAETEIPKSIFRVPSAPNEGRNPFFPESTQGQVIATAKTNREPATSFVLNGITSPPKPTAMINGRTFEPGEKGEVRLPGGSRVAITCAEIRESSAVIEVGSERRELRLRSGI